MTIKIKAIQYKKEKDFLINKAKIEEKTNHDISTLKSLTSNLYRNREKFKNIDEMSIENIINVLMEINESKLNNTDIFPNSKKIIPTFRVLANLIKNNELRDVYKFFNKKLKKTGFDSPLFSVFFDNRKQIIVVKSNVYISLFSEIKMFYLLQENIEDDQWINIAYTDGYSYKYGSSKTTILENFIEKKIDVKIKKTKKETNKVDDFSC